MTRAVLSGLLLLAVLGCSTVKDYERPAIELPAGWKDSAPRYAEDGRWWRIYEDAQLNALVDEALEKNQDLLIAAARVDEARALVGEVQAGYFPSVDARGSATRQQNSTKTAVSPPGVPREYSTYRGTLNVSYELDIFGRIRSGAQAARADLAASEAARDGVRLALAAQVAKSYFALRALDQQVTLTRETVRLREEALGLQLKRRDAGVTSEFEYRQLEADAAGIRAQLPPLEREREREEAALSVLLGRSPREIFEAPVARRPAADEAPAAPVLPSGMPSELLLRRPDLVEAEQRLRRATRASARRAPRCSLRSLSPRRSAARAPRSRTCSPAARASGRSGSRSASRSSPAGAWKRAPRPRRRASAP